MSGKDRLFEAMGRAQRWQSVLFFLCFLIHFWLIRSKAQSSIFMRKTTDWISCSVKLYSWKLSITSFLPASIQTPYGIHVAILSEKLFMSFIQNLLCHDFMADKPSPVWHRRLSLLFTKFLSTTHLMNDFIYAHRYGTIAKTRDATLNFQTAS